MLAQSVRTFNLRRTESLPNSHVLFLRVRTPPCARPGGGDETGQPRPAFWADDFITGQTINVDGGKEEKEKGSSLLLAQLGKKNINTKVRLGRANPGDGVGSKM